MASSSRTYTYTRSILNIEMFDVSVPTALNEPGLQKLQDGMLYGINPPISTLIEELNTIIMANPGDLKANKRIRRREFLELCDRSWLLDILFQLYFNFLCRTNDDDNVGLTKQFKGQKLILVVTGGNIFAIYALILHEISEIDEFDENILSKITYAIFIAAARNIINYFNSSHPRTTLDPMSAIENIYTILDKNRKFIAKELLSDFYPNPESMPTDPRLLTPETPEFQIARRLFFYAREIIFITKDSKHNKLVDKIKEMIQYPLSDLDWSIKPNEWNELLRETQSPVVTLEQKKKRMACFKKTAEFYKTILKHQDGFVLGRIRTTQYFNKNFTGTIADLKSRCNDKYKKLLPFEVTEAILQDAIDKENCVDYLKYLIYKREEIAKYTLVMVDSIQEQAKTDPTISSIKSNIDAIVKAISSKTKQLNTEIKRIQGEPLNNMYDKTPQAYFDILEGMYATQEGLCKTIPNEEDAEMQAAEKEIREIVKEQLKDEHLIDLYYYDPGSPEGDAASSLLPTSNIELSELERTMSFNETERETSYILLKTLDDDYEVDYKVTRQDEYVKSVDTFWETSNKKTPQSISNPTFNWIEQLNAVTNPMIIYYLFMSVKTMMENPLILKFISDILLKLHALPETKTIVNTIYIKKPGVSLPEKEGTFLAVPNKYKFVNYELGKVKDVFDAKKLLTPKLLTPNTVTSFNVVIQDSYTMSDATGTGQQGPAALAAPAALAEPTNIEAAKKIQAAAKIQIKIQADQREQKKQTERERLYIVKLNKEKMKLIDAQLAENAKLKEKEKKAIQDAEREERIARRRRDIATTTSSAISSGGGGAEEAALVVAAVDAAKKAIVANRKINDAYNKIIMETKTTDILKDKMKGWQRLKAAVAAARAVAARVAAARARARAAAAVTETEEASRKRGRYGSEDEGAAAMEAERAVPEAEADEKGEEADEEGEEEGEEDGEKGEKGEEGEEEAPPPPPPPPPAASAAAAEAAEERAAAAYKKRVRDPSTYNPKLREQRRRNSAEAMAAKKAAKAAAAAREASAVQEKRKRGEEVDVDVFNARWGAHLPTAAPLPQPKEPRRGGKQNYNKTIKYKTIKDKLKKHKVKKNKTIKHNLKNNNIINKKLKIHKLQKCKTKKNIKQKPNNYKTIKHSIL